MKSKYTLLAESFKALGDENRLKILEALGDGQMFATELLEKLNVAQPTLSHHMKILCDSGLVDARRDGKWTYYSVSEDGKNELVQALLNITSIEGEEEAITIKKEKKAPKKKKVEKKPIEEILSEIEESYDVEEAPVFEEEPLEEVKEEIIEEVPEIKEEKRAMPSWLF